MNIPNTKLLNAKLRAAIKGILFLFYKKDTEAIGTVRRNLRLSRIGRGISWVWKRPFPLLGTTYRVNLNREINSHIAIMGESGSGKSNACKLILKRLNGQGIKTIIFDSHNEYVEMADDINARVFIAQYAGINILGLDGMNERERASELAEMFRRTFGLGSVQTSLLHRCILYTYNIIGSRGGEAAMSDLLYSIKVFMRRASKTEANTLDSLEKRLRLLGSPNKTLKFDDVLENSSIFALSGLHSSDAQQAYIEGFLKRMYTKMLGMQKSDGIRICIVIDEAEKLIEGSSISRIMAEGRKYGIGIVTISQRAKGIDKSIRSNASTLIAFYQREPEELNYIANLIACGNELNRFIEVKKAMRELKKGHAIVVSSSRKEPSIVRFKLHTGERTYFGHEVIEASKKGIRKEELVAAMQKKGFGYEDIRETAEKLLKEGSLKQCTIESGPNAGHWCISMAKNSAEHDVSVNLISRHLSSLGIRNYVYNSSYGPDVVAFMNSERIAFEYETGANSIESARKMLEGRKQKYARVIVVINDRHFERYGMEGIERYKASEFFSVFTA